MYMPMITAGPSTQEILDACRATHPRSTVALSLVGGDLAGSQCLNFFVSTIEIHFDSNDWKLTLVSADISSPIPIEAYLNPQTGKGVINL